MGRGREKPMQLIYLDLESDRPQFIEDPTFNVIPNIEDFIDVFNLILNRGKHLNIYNIGTSESDMNNETSING